MTTDVFVFSFCYSGNWANRSYIHGKECQLFCWLFIKVSCHRDVEWEYRPFFSPQIAAKRLGFTNGDYVYLSLDTFRADILGPNGWKQSENNEDPV